MSDALCFVYARAPARPATKHPALRLRGGRRTRFRFLCSFSEGLALGLGVALYAGGLLLFLPASVSGHYLAMFLFCGGIPASPAR